MATKKNKKNGRSKKTSPKKASSTKSKKGGRSKKADSAVIAAYKKGRASCASPTDLQIRAQNKAAREAAKSAKAAATSAAKAEKAITKSEKVITAAAAKVTKAQSMKKTSKKTAASKKTARASKTPAAEIQKAVKAEVAKATKAQKPKSRKPKKRTAAQKAAAYKKKRLAQKAAAKAAGKAPAPSKRRKKQRAKYAAAGQASFSSMGKPGTSKPVQNATRLADAETTAEAATDAAKTIARATREVASEHKVTGDMILRGEAPESSLEKIEHVAKKTLSLPTRFGAALRTAASYKATRVGVVTAHLTGLLDSTGPMAQLDNLSLSATGVGYKAWTGLGFLALSAVADVAANTTKTEKGFRQALTIAEYSAYMADTHLSLESYNLGVTRYSRVRAVAASLLGLPGAAPEPAPVESVTGLGMMAARRIGKGAIAKRIRERTGGAIQDIDLDDVERIAFFFDVAPQVQDMIFGAPEEEFVPLSAPVEFAQEDSSRRETA